MPPPNTDPNARGPAPSPRRLAYAADGSVDYFYARSGGGDVVFYTVPADVGTVQLHREDADGTFHAIGAAIVVAAGVEDSQQIAFPMVGLVRVRYTNTDTNAGLCLFQAREE